MGLLDGDFCMGGRPIGGWGSSHEANALRTIAAHHFPYEKYETPKCGICSSNASEKIGCWAAERGDGIKSVTGVFKTLFCVNRLVAALRDTSGLS